MANVDAFKCSPDWFTALQRYVQETDATTLDLSGMKYSRIKLEPSEVFSIIKFLEGSQVCELDLSDINLQNHMKTLSKLLIKTKIRKLKLNSCSLTKADISTLMRILKETQINSVNISHNDAYDNARAFSSCMTNVHLETLNLANCFDFLCEKKTEIFFKALCSNDLTHLYLGDVFRKLNSSEALVTGLKNLAHTSITCLNLRGNNVKLWDLQQLDRSLRNSKLVELDLSYNGIDDDGIDALFKALDGSKISILNLSRNRFKGSNNLGTLLKKTQITKLDLSHNSTINDPKMFAFPHFLKDTMVVSLNLGVCRMGDDIVVPLVKSLSTSKLTALHLLGNGFGQKSLTQLVKIFKRTNISEFNFSLDSSFSFNKSLISFGKAIIGSKLNHLNITGFSRPSMGLPRPPISDLRFLPEFFALINLSAVTSIELVCLPIGSRGMEVMAPFLSKTQLTNLTFSRCYLCYQGVLSLASNLKLTAITHLNLMLNYIDDKSATALANCLKETNIINLNLGWNQISCKGATALALFLKDVKVFSLNLSRNCIRDDGLKALAEHIEPNLITDLDVSLNPGNSVEVQTVLWNNRRLVRQLVSFFKRIVPDTVDSTLRFKDAASSSDGDDFLDECLSFYKLVVERTCVASILANEGSVTLSRDQIETLLSDKFPQQFVDFIALYIEADTVEHIKFLMKVEEFGLHQIVELLLLNRDFYIIDKSQDILDPHIYKTLIKYKIPISNLGVDPEGINRIVEYFTAHTDIDGTADVVSMLRTMNKTTKKEIDSDPEPLSKRRARKRKRNP